jgi:hypothetical protein
MWYGWPGRGPEAAVVMARRQCATVSAMGLHEMGTEECVMAKDNDKTRATAQSPDALAKPEKERRAERESRDADGRPLHGEETAPGERGDGPYGDSEPRVRGDRPGT